MGRPLQVIDSTTHSLVAIDVKIFISKDMFIYAILSWTLQSHVRHCNYMSHNVAITLLSLEGTWTDNDYDPTKYAATFNSSLHMKE